MALLIEDKLLRYCAKVDLDEKSKDQLEKTLQNSLNWSYILQQSKKEGTTYLIYHNLMQYKKKVPQDIWNNFRKIYYVNISRNTKIYQEMSATLSDFNQENLRLIPLKGIFLAEKIYNNIALRPIATDIDLLIKKEDIFVVDRLLNNSGYSCFVHKELLGLAMKKSYMNSIDYFKINEQLPRLHIHWHIINATLPTYMYSKPINMNEFWERSSPTTIAGQETWQLSFHHLILHLSEHGLKHSFDRLILLSDIDAVIKKYKEQIRWSGLIKEANELGMERQLYYGLFFAKYFLDTDIPEIVLSELKPEKINTFEKRFLSSVLNNNRDTKLCYFVYLGMIKGPINKFRFILRTLFPPACVLALTFNLNKPKITVRDYFIYMRKQFFYIKNYVMSLRPHAK